MRHRWLTAPGVLLATLLLAHFAAAQDDATDAPRYVLTDQFVDVTDGTTMFYLVREFYPLRRNNWLEVAHDLAVANPKAFRNGDPGALIIGRRIYLIDYGEGVESRPPGGTARSNDAPHLASARAANDAAAVDADAVVSGVDEAPTTAVATADSSAIDAANGTAIATLIGHVARLRGRASAGRPGAPPRTMSQGAPVHRGDSLATAADSHVSLLMLDGGVVHLRPDSRISFETYGAAPARAVNNSVITLSAGALRVVTGSDAATPTVINTAVATVSTRQADFALRLCRDGTCRVDTLSVPVADGLYCAVADGEVSLSNNTGVTTAARGVVLRTRDANGKPQQAPEALGATYTPIELTDLDLRGDEPLGFWAWFRQRFF